MYFFSWREGGREGKVPYMLALNHKLKMFPYYMIYSQSLYPLVNWSMLFPIPFFLLLLLLFRNFFIFTLALYCKVLSGGNTSFLLILLSCMIYLTWIHKKTFSTLLSFPVRERCNSTHEWLYCITELWFSHITSSNSQQIVNRLIQQCFSCRSTVEFYKLPYGVGDQRQLKMVLFVWMFCFPKTPKPFGNDCCVRHARTPSWRMLIALFHGVSTAITKVEWRNFTKFKILSMKE